MNFHETVIGHKFFNNDFPKLLRELSGLRTAIEEQNKLQKEEFAPLPCALCKVCVHYNDGKFCPGCCDCVAHNWGNFQHVDNTENQYL